MKNITALRVYVIIIFLFFSNYSVYCQNREKTYVFSAGPQFGFVYGQAQELLYALPKDTMNEFLSELKWDIKPVYYAGIELNYGLLDPMASAGFFSSLSFKAGFPNDSGIHENRDWMSPDNSNLTHFSSHTNRTRQFFALDTEFGFSLPVGSFLCVKPFVSGSWMRLAFTGRDGYGIYPNGEHSFTGDVIRYKQDWFIFAPGLSVGTRFFAFFYFDVSCRVSMFTYCAAKDEHIQVKKTFMDYTLAGFFLEPAGRFSFIQNWLELSLEFSYRRIGRTNGQTYTSYDNMNFFLEQNKAGAGLSLMDTRFLVKMRF
ncbi:MAG: omptin family outer membrane protease [Treponema sp.]|jgi:outer membrane protease|nr:omptin family outer membrane protease [Treponema sp.]